jgi:hypothetical protein
MDCPQRICPGRIMHVNVRRLRPELCRQKNWLLHHDSAPSRREHDCRHPPTLLTWLRPLWLFSPSWR